MSKLTKTLLMSSFLTALCISSCGCSHYSGYQKRQELVNQRYSTNSFEKIEDEDRITFVPLIYYSFGAPIPVEGQRGK